ncbi:hypothetical protein L211DRAFT_788273 [Terfezia boudieri ATCC MYA-4762]|uniref:SGF29 C-terminal domain-containing protein n=1 Tax=Terfezia boudieri ATCC MYA-4762 TaxID=1051890 RepID=A0A3N4LMF2_9PEZI|nr:hypothetical protein L211DRAFT_788273 [Terfezia boudieri ATCC MYA-4762]
MGGRNRPRAGVQKDDADSHEESIIWTKIVNELKNLHTLSIKVDNAEAKITQEERNAEDPTSQELSRLLAQYSDLLELVESLEKQLSSTSEDTILLLALRTATEGGDRATETKRKKRKLDDDNPPTPMYSRTKMARSNSAAPNANTLPNPSKPDRGGDRDSIANDRAVAYRLPKQKGGGQEGEFIQCIIIDITGEGGKRRYTIQDPEPDEAGGLGLVYKATANSLIPIPKDSIGLPSYPVGKQVLAMYPETTMFYRAEVMGTKRDGTCRLKFEGEEEVGKETEVERRLVLDVGGR